MPSTTDLPNPSGLGSMSPDYTANAGPSISALNGIVNLVDSFAKDASKRAADKGLNDLANTLQSIHDDSEMNIMEKNKKINDLKRTAQAKLPSEYFPKVNEIFSGQHLRQAPQVGGGTLITDEAGNPIGEQQAAMDPQTVMTEDFQNQLMHVGSAFPQSGEYVLDVHNRVGYEPHEFQTHVATVYAVDAASEARKEALPQQLHGYDAGQQKSILEDYVKTSVGDLGKLNNLFISPQTFQAIKSGKITKEEVMLAAEGMQNEYISQQPSSIDQGALYAAKTANIEHLSKLYDSAADMDNITFARNSKRLQLMAEDKKNLYDIANGDTNRDLAAAVDRSEATYKGATIFNENMAKMKDPTASPLQIQQAATLADVGAGLVGKASGIQFASATKANFQKMSGISKTVDMALQQPKMTPEVLNHIIADTASLVNDKITMAINQEEVAGFMNEKIFPLLEKGVQNGAIRPEVALAKLNQFEQSYGAASALRAKHPEWTKADGQKLKTEVGAPSSTWGMIDDAKSMISGWKKKFMDMGKPPVDQSGKVPTGGGQSPKKQGLLGSLLTSDAQAADTADSIASISEQYGNDPNLMVAIAHRESKLGKHTESKTSSAKGLFQFIDSTWNAMVNKYGKEDGLTKDGVHDPVQNVKAANRLLNENKASLQKKLGREPNNAELYLAHLMGAYGAGRFLDELDNPRPAAELFPKQAKANKNVFKNKTTQQIYTELAMEF
ncbi:MAG: lytic transglycosylase domain-containing protein [Magnetococcus sp. YQC-3]